MVVINRDRFTGFAETYDQNRPVPPPKVIEIARQLMTRETFDLVVDLGAGTGLSTAVWKEASKRVVGIEPTDDMRKVAVARYPDIEFRPVSSYSTEQESGSVDIVSCSQSFH